MIIDSPDDSTFHVNALPDCDERPIGLPPGLDERRFCNLFAQKAKFIAHYPTEDEAIAAFRQWCSDRIQSRDREEMADGDTPEQDSDGVDYEYNERSREFYDGLGDLNAA